MKQQISSKFLNGLVIAGIVLTILTLIATPLVLTALQKVSGMKASLSPNIVYAATVCIYVCGVPYLVALFKLKFISAQLFSDNPFSSKVSTAFQTIAYCAFSAAVLFLASVLILYFGFGLFLYAMTLVPSIIVPFVAVVAGLFALVISNIFKKAGEIKDENDLTF